MDMKCPGCKRYCLQLEFFQQHQVIHALERKKIESKTTDERESLPVLYIMQDDENISMFPDSGSGANCQDDPLSGIERDPLEISSLEESSCDLLQNSDSLVMDLHGNHGIDTLQVRNSAKTTSQGELASGIIQNIHPLAVSVQGDSETITLHKADTAETVTLQMVSCGGIAEEMHSLTVQVQNSSEDGILQGKDPLALFH